MKRRVKVTDRGDGNGKWEMWNGNGCGCGCACGGYYIYYTHEGIIGILSRLRMRAEFMQTASKFTTIFMKPSGPRCPWTQLEQLYDGNTPEYPARKLEHKYMCTGRIREEIRKLILKSIKVAKREIFIGLTILLKVFAVGVSRLPTRLRVRLPAKPSQAAN